MSVVKVVKAPVVEPIEAVTIVLSHDEAQELVAILGRGASLVDELYAKLLHQGVRHDRYAASIECGSIKIRHQ